MNRFLSIYKSLDENERFAVSAGLFPIRLEKEKLSSQELAELIVMAQNATGVRL